VTFVDVVVAVAVAMAVTVTFVIIIHVIVILYVLSLSLSLSLSQSTLLLQLLLLLLRLSLCSLSQLSLFVFYRLLHQFHAIPRYSWVGQGTPPFPPQRRGQLPASILKPEVSRLKMCLSSPCPQSRPGSHGLS